MSMQAFQRVCLAILGLSASALGCSSADQTGGCQKDTDCREGRICENHVCINAGSGGSSGSAGTGGSGGTSGCANAGESCGVNGDCCKFQSQTPAGFCVNGICSDACASGAECVSGCCAQLEVSGSACAPAEICSKSCFATGEPCAVNGDCCNFLANAGFCAGGFCSDKCTSAAECASGCCATLESGDMACAPEYICG
ncbi:MAG TPA: hypothetical protein VGP93_11295 [Polyangiaceae bacterium]|nr:hypothetical protein [Polyangiaceae bacterium]